MQDSILYKILILSEVNTLGMFSHALSERLKKVGLGLSYLLEYICTGI